MNVLSLPYLLILVLSLIIFTAVIVLIQVVVTIDDPLIPQLIAEIPMFFDYDDIAMDWMCSLFDLGFRCHKKSEKQ